MLFCTPKQEAQVKETTVVIYGKEREWLKRFADQLRERTKLRLKVMEFSAEELARSYLREHPVDLAILPEEMAAEYASVCEVLYFTEEKRPAEERAMYRYRSMSRHLEQIMAFCGRKPEEGAGGKTDVHVVWSPVRASGASAAAMLLGQLMAEKEPVLLLDTGRWSVLPAMLAREKEGSLADLLYYARVGADPAAHLSENEEREGSLAWICPAQEAADLRSASQKDWTVLVQALKACGRYRHIVIDAGDGPADETWLLKTADRIWMPLRKDGISLQRERIFCEALEREGKIELLDHVRRFVLPETDELRELLDYRQLLFTEWGRFMRGLLRESEL